MDGDDLHRRIEAHRAAGREREIARALATSKATAELQRMVQELQAIQRSRPEARSLGEPVFVAGTAPIAIHSEDVSGADADWRAGPGHEPPHISNIVGLYTVSYNPVRGVWLTHSQLDTISREEAINLFKDALAKWIALEYPKQVKKELDEKVAKEAEEKAEREAQRLLGRQEKDKQLRDLLGLGATFLITLYIGAELRAANVLSMSLVEGLFTLIIGYGVGIITIASGLFMIRAAFVYFFD